MVISVKLAQTIRHYDKKNLIKDIIAGIIIMAVSIPISMGYAQIAGLPAVYGLYGFVFPILVFAIFSTSPQFVFGVDAVQWTVPCHVPLWESSIRQRHN